MIKFHFAALISTLLLTSPVLGGEIARTIEWEDLVPKMEPLEDPFYTLTTEQLLDLEFLVSARKKKAAGQIFGCSCNFRKSDTSPPQPHSPRTRCRRVDSRL